MFVPQSGVEYSERRRASVMSGAEAEVTFRQAITMAGWRILAKATDQQDRSEHWDFKIGKGSEVYTVDVKAMKSLQRGGDTQDQYICCELHGTAPHSLGWLYGGKADLIAFQFAGGFYLVSRVRLGALVKKLVRLGDVVFNSAEAIYRVYSRKENEWVSWIRTSDLHKEEGVIYAVVKG
jgi:hypothetical protein